MFDKRSIKIQNLFAPIKVPVLTRKEQLGQDCNSTMQPASEQEPAEAAKEDDQDQPKKRKGKKDQPKDDSEPAAKKPRGRKAKAVDQDEKPQPKKVSKKKTVKPEKEEKEDEKEDHQEDPEEEEREKDEEEKADEKKDHQEDPKEEECEKDEEEKADEKKDHQESKTAKKPGAKAAPKAKAKAKAKSKVTKKKDDAKDKKDAKGSGKGKKPVKEDPKTAKRKGSAKDHEGEVEQQPKKQPKRKAKEEIGEDAEAPAAPAKKTPATWAGRWLPTDPIAMKKFDAIRKVFNEACAPKIRSQSTLQSPFFMQCSKAFKSQEIADDAAIEEFIACAELQVDSFMKTERVRHLENLKLQRCDPKLVSSHFWFNLHFLHPKQSTMGWCLKEPHIILPILML